MPGTNIAARCRGKISARDGISDFRFARGNTLLEEVAGREELGVVFAVDNFFENVSCRLRFTTLFWNAHEPGSEIFTGTIGCSGVHFYLSHFLKCKNQ
jgi:hypothetical protein